MDCKEALEVIHFIKTYWGMDGDCLEALDAAESALQLKEIIIDRVHGDIPENATNGEIDKRDRHKWDDLFESGVIDRRVWRIVGMLSRVKGIIGIDGDFCIEDLAMITEKQISNLRGMGKLRIGRLKAVMEEYGVKFKEVQ